MSQVTLRFKDVGHGAIEIELQFESIRDENAVLTPAESAALSYFESQFPDIAEGMKTQH